MLFSLFTSFALLYLVSGQNPAPNPTVQIKSGVFTGVHLDTFVQDAWLGVPYAPKPTRFSPATKVLPSTAQRNATTYGYSCPAYGSDTTRLVQAGLITLNEDCLNLNIIRPTGAAKNLPVLVWIYGGGWQQGATADPRYNMSYIIQQSTLAGNPLIGVSINYRTAGFGFIFGKEVMNTGNTNLGLRDQRLALDFIQENIGAFGGDPRKVAIWGESAGADSVGSHLIAHGGEKNPPFRAAIMESGAAVGAPFNDARWYQPAYDRVATATGCLNVTDSLQCLREVPYDTLYPALNVGLPWFAVIDGAMIREWPSAALRAGRFARVPILIGSNTDEGISFGTDGVNTDQDAVFELIVSDRWVIAPFQAEKIVPMYSNDPAEGSPYGTGNLTFPPRGALFKKYSSIAGDINMMAARRLSSRSYAAAGQKVYSYRFDAPLFNTSTTIGVTHFSEIPFVFANPDQTITPLGPSPADLKLGHLLARSWASFAVHLDPNLHRVEGVPQWPLYQGIGENIVFRTNNETYVEVDAAREDAIAYINTILR